MAKQSINQAGETRSMEADRPIEIRQGENAMLSFAVATDVNLDPFFEAIVELLLDRLEQLGNERKEK